MDTELTEADVLCLLVREAFMDLNRGADTREQCGVECLLRDLNVCEDGQAAK